MTATSSGESSYPSKEFLVGTFNRNEIFTLSFTPSGATSSKLSIVKRNLAVGPHSWLAFSADRRNVYATVWSEPPMVAAYEVSSTRELRPINTAPVRKRSGYVCVSATHLFSVGGPSGEVFALRPDGGIGNLVQELPMLTEEDEHKQKGNESDVPHGDFGGVRHGAHSCDLSPDGSTLYVADIGRNCIWSYSVNEKNATTTTAEDEGLQILSLRSITSAPSPGDGSRHAWPHPNGKVVYSLQEHSSMVDAYAVTDDGTELELLQPRVRCIPAGKDAKDFWADEVRTSSISSGNIPPRYLYASARGLASGTHGYVAVFSLDKQGHIVSADPTDILETRTSGGWANAIEPSPRHASDGDKEYIALTDSQEGFVSVLSFDGKRLREEASINLSEEGSGYTGAATAIWY